MIKQTAKVIPSKIKVVAVQLIKAHFDAGDSFLEDKPKPASFSFGMAHDLGYNAREQLSRCRLFINLEALDAKDNPLGPTLEYGLEFVFQLGNLQDFIAEETDTGPKMAASIGATLLGMAYSTARGIIYERTRGTYFDGVLLPVIDPYEALVSMNQKALE